MKMLDLKHGEKFQSPFYPNSVLMKVSLSKARGELFNAVDVDTGMHFLVSNTTGVTKVAFKFEATSKNFAVYSK
ncbi:MAG: hypothetical protein ACRCTW_11185 [Lactococcus garvieae]